MAAETVAGSEFCWSDWAELPPGPELGFRLAIVDMAALGDDELAEVMAAAQRQTSWAQSVELAAVAELSRRRYAEERLERVRWTSSTHERLVDEVSADLTVPSGAAQELVWLAEALTKCHVRTWAALVAGRIDYRRAKVIAEALQGLDEDLAGRVEAKVIPDAPDLTVTKLRIRLKRAVKAADPAAAEEKTKAARRERRLERWENASGTSDLVGRDLASEDVEAIWNRLTAVARAMREDGDGRSLDAIRADLYRDLLHGVLLPEAARRLRGDEETARTTSPGTPETGPHSATESGPDTDLRDGSRTGHQRASQGDSQSGSSVGDPAARSVGDADVQAEVERQIAEALAGAADEHLRGLLAQARADGRTEGIALLITEAVAEMQKAVQSLTGQWCQATGQHAHDGYRPPARMQRRIRRRHDTCVFPTCNRKSAACDLDHTRPYDPNGPDGGRTRPDNLAPLCRRHHRTKQHRRWRLIQLFPGLLVWITPAGRWHLILPSSRQ